MMVTSTEAHHRGTEELPLPRTWSSVPFQVDDALEEAARADLRYVVLLRI